MIQGKVIVGEKEIPFEFKYVWQVIWFVHTMNILVKFLNWYYREK